MTIKSLLQPFDVSSEQNRLHYVISKMLSQANFIELVVIISVDSNAETVTIKPLSKSVDGSGTSREAEEVYDIPYFRLQMGTSAVIMDPSVGDIGLMLVCDENIHNIKESKVASVPANGHRHSRADGIYLGGIGLLNATPTEYIKFTGSGIKIVGDVDLTGKLTTSSTITAAGEITGNGIKLSTHVHSGVESGSSSTGEPE